jgi:hypothetical protein
MTLPLVPCAGSALRPPPVLTPWPQVRLMAWPEGEIDPYDSANGPLFRGEEAFGADVDGWRRWSKPSPEPPVDGALRAAVHQSIERSAPVMRAGVARLALEVLATDPRPPVLLAVLRAGVPVAWLLAAELGRRLGQAVPVVAISVFDRLGWDTAALEAVLADHPGRAVWFVDGWTSRGGVARALRTAHQGWLAEGRPDFTDGHGPRLAVLLDPAGHADATGLRADRLVPSSCFTAPETLGFSRTFATSGAEDWHRVYTFPQRLLRPDLVAAFCALADAPAEPAPPPGAAPTCEKPPAGVRLHCNEVVRALINRNPRAVWVAADAATAEAELSPVLHLARLRDVPVLFDRAEVAAWGALAACPMT